MGSFKLDKTGSHKNDIRNGGVFLLAIGLFVAIAFSVVVGGIMAVIGLILALGGAFASE